MTTSLTPSALVKIVCMTNKGCKLQYSAPNQDKLYDGLCQVVPAYREAAALNCSLLPAAEYAVRDKPELAAKFQAMYEDSIEALAAIDEGRAR